MDSITNGLTQGNFTLLQVLDPTTNQLVNVLTLINNATGGVQSAQAPLAINTGVLSIDLSAYSTATDIQTLLNNYTDTTALNTLLTNYVLLSTLTSTLANYTDTTALNTLLGNYVLTSTLSSTLANYTDTSGLNALLGSYVLTTTLNSTLANYIDTNALTTLLSNKQDNLSVTGQGVFLSGSVLNGYDLRWNTNSTPTAPIQCLRFEDLNVVQNINLSSGQLELQVSASNKQDTLSYYSESTANTSIGSYIYSPSNIPAWVNPYFTNNGTASQDVTFQVYLSLFGTTVGRAYMWSVDLKSDGNTTPEILVTIGDSTTFNYGKIFNLSDAWQTIQLPWFGMSTNAANFHLGYDAPPLGLTQPGGAGIQVQLRHFAIYEVGSQANVAISQQLSVASDVRIAGSIINTSDSRLKTDVQAVDSAKALSILQSVEPKTYSRTDMEAGTRLGFLADDIMTACLDNELYVSNLVSRTGDGQYLGLDYSRLVSILWSVCKQQEERIQALEAKN